jgi:hypothetical protein
VVFLVLSFLPRIFSYSFGDNRVINVVSGVSFLWSLLELEKRRPEEKDWREGIEEDPKQVNSGLASPSRLRSYPSRLKRLALRLHFVACDIGRQTETGS